MLFKKVEPTLKIVELFKPKVMPLMNWPNQEKFQIHKLFVPLELGNGVLKKRKMKMKNHKRRKRRKANRYKSVNKN